MPPTTPLHEDFGVEVHGIDLRTVSRDDLFPEIRALFEEHSVLLFRGQDLDETTRRRLAELVGALEDLRDAAQGQPIERSVLSNVSKPGALVDDPDLRLMNLKANFLWHADSTFLPTPSLANVLVGYVIPPSGNGATELVSTRIGRQRMAEHVKARARDAVIIHRFSQSRKLAEERLSQHPANTRYSDTPWKAVWRNPVNGRDALFIAAHACGVQGLDDADGMDLINALIDATTQPGAIYAHHWREGDVLIWDQRATLHRGTPWNYDEERTLASFVSSATEQDGIANVRP